MFKSLITNIKDLFTFTVNSLLIVNNKLPKLELFQHKICVARNRETEEENYFYIKYAYYNMYSQSPIKYMGVMLEPHNNMLYDNITQVAMTTFGSAEWELVDSLNEVHGGTDHRCIEALKKLRTHHMHQSFKD